MRKTLLGRTTLVLAVIFACAAVLFASRYFTEKSHTLRIQQESEGHSHLGDGPGDEHDDEH